MGKKPFEQLTRLERQNRYFSETFKRKKVDEIDRNLITVSEVCREYQVSSTSVYQWIYKYSAYRSRSVKQVIEMDSDTKKIAALKAKIKELEQMVGQKQIELEFTKKMVEFASEEVGFDIKKKYGDGPLSGSSSSRESIKSK